MFSFETKDSISFIRIKRMFWWCLIMKGKKIIMWIHVCPNRRTNINSKNCRKRCFSYETKASISFIPMRWLHLWCLIMKGKEINLWIRVYRNQPMNINSKNGGKRFFLMKPKHLYHLSQWGEWIYGTHSLKKRRLLYESEFIQLKIKL